MRAVAADDALLIREILPTKRVGLTDEELADALADRGIPHEGLPRKQQEVDDEVGVSSPFRAIQMG